MCHAEQAFHPAGAPCAPHVSRATSELVQSAGSLHCVGSELLRTAGPPAASRERCINRILLRYSCILSKSADTSGTGEQASWAACPEMPVLDMIHYLHSIISLSDRMSGKLIYLQDIEK